MAQPLNLARLPKAGRLRFVQFKRTTPGNFTRLIAPQKVSAAPVVDESHPLALVLPKAYARTLPCFETRLMTVRAYPKALLGKPEDPYNDPPFTPASPTPYGRDGRLLDQRRKRVNMSLMHIVTKNIVGKSAVVRHRVKTRTRAAIGLIVARGATVENIGGKDQIVVSNDDIGEKWILQDWTYVFSPNLELYRMPLTDLIKGLQEVLTMVNDKCRWLEEKWKQTAKARARMQKKTNQENDIQVMSSYSLDRPRPPPLESPKPRNSRKPPELIPDDLFLEDEKDERQSTTKPNSTLWNEKSKQPVRNSDARELPTARSSNSKYTSSDFSEDSIERPNTSTAAIDKKPNSSMAIFRHKPIIRPSFEEEPRRTTRRR